MTSALQQNRASGRRDDSSMICPKCGAGVRTVDSRSAPNNSIRRRRMCTVPTCAHRFTTYETALDVSPLPVSAILFLVSQVEATLPAMQAALNKLKHGLQAAETISELAK